MKIPKHWKNEIMWILKTHGFSEHYEAVVNQLEQVPFFPYHELQMRVRKILFVIPRIAKTKETVLSNIKNNTNEIKKDEVKVDDKINKENELDIKDKQNINIIPKDQNKVEVADAKQQPLTKTNRKMVGLFDVSEPIKYILIKK